MTKPETDGEKKAGKTALDGVKRDTFFRVKYNDPAIVVRVIDNPEHPEYDARAALPVNMDRVWSLRMHGQLNAATGYKLKDQDGEGRWVVVLTSGRQRWKAMQKIWEEDLAAGVDPKDLPTFKITLHPEGYAKDRVEISIVENEHRVQDEPIERARKIRRYLDQVGDDELTRERVLKLFGVPSRAMLENVLKLLDLTPKAQAAVTAGEITPTLGTDISRLPAEQQDQVVEQIKEAPTRPTVKEGKEMIRELTGAAPKFEMVTLKQVEKQIERKEAELEKAKTRLEQCPTSMYDNNYQKTVNQAAKVAEIQGEIKALRWARGENAASGSDAPLQGNDKMSAAWEALREAITSAPWPKVLREKDFEWPEVPRWNGEDPSVQQAYHAAMDTRTEYRERMDESRLLVIAGEKVARRDVNSQGETYNLLIDADSKWFTRLMDPFGKPSQLVREWGAHGFLEPQGKAATTPTYRMGCSALCKGRTAIQIKRGNSLTKWLEGTPLAFVAPSVGEVVRKIIGTLFPEKHIHHEIRFHAPYLEEGDGPDLNETLEARKEILSLIEEELDFNIDNPDLSWKTVGELVAWVEKEVKDLADPGPDPVPEEVEDAGDDQVDADGQGGDA